MIFSFYPVIKQSGKSFIGIVKKINQNIWIRYSKFCRCTRCWRSQIWNKIADCIVCFMAYGRYYRCVAIENCPCNLFCVKCPQIFKRATASADYDYINVTAFIKNFDWFSNIISRFVTLHYCRRNYKFCNRVSSFGNIFYIFNCRTHIWSCNTDFFWIFWNGFFINIIKKTFFWKLFFHLLKSYCERTYAVRLHIVNIKLICSVFIIKWNSAPAQNFHSVARFKFKPACIWWKHNCLNLRIFILKREINMPRTKIMQKITYFTYNKNVF